MPCNILRCLAILFLQISDIRQYARINIFRHDQRAAAVGEGAAHMQRHIESLRVFHTTQGKHLGTAGRHFQHRLVVDDGNTTCGRYNTRIGGEHAIDVGVDLAYSATAKATAEVSDPPRPSVVASPPSFTPWKPATMATEPLSSARRTRSGFTALICAVPNWASVMKPAWEPVKE